MMNLEKIVTVLVVLLYSFTEATNDNDSKQQLLRKAISNMPESLTSSSSMDQGRHLQILGNVLDPCSLIAGQFTIGQVNCECNAKVFRGTVDYTCTWISEICVGGDNGLCGTPIYSGTLDAFKLNVENEVCIQGVSALGGLQVDLGDFCVNLVVNPRNDKLITCSATLGDIACNSCVPCPGGGLTLDCANVADGATDSCSSPIQTITRLNKSNKKVQILKPFFPNFNLN
jgi:hypothetical protein